MGGSVLPAAQGSAALWYLTRATGVVAVILLSAVVVLGITTSLGWSSNRWPRFFSHALHRDLSLLCLALIAVHVVTTILDGFVPFGYLDAVVPFHPPARALWQGLGALAFDLFLVLGITSALRQRIGYRMWRVIHWVAYLCWPIAVFHGLGAGTDARLEPVVLIDAVCVSAVLATAGWRLATGWRGHSGGRLLGGFGTSVVTAALICFVALGPLQSNGSRHWTLSPITAGSASRANGQIAHPTRTASHRGPNVAPAIPTAQSPSPSNQPPSDPSGANPPNAAPGQASHPVGGVSSPSLPLPSTPSSPTPPPSLHIAPPSLNGKPTDICEHVTICRPTDTSRRGLPRDGDASHW
ncbi:MAG TPA: ferric reductase-like transmembrane domain-containing protein [Acidimicrobiales bacterium]|nr:ferric reductase-like transmembrane domain-containing protein [Acidimicrobiales bacterium]